MKRARDAVYMMLKAGSYLYSYADDIAFTTQNRQKAKEAEMNAHLGKPLDIQKMMSVISKYIKD